MKSLITVALVLMSICPAFGQLSGTKTIGGTSPDYSTIRDAFNAVSSQGVSSPGVTFTIRGGTYNEDSLVVKTATAKAAAPIVVKPAAGATVVINVTPTTYYNQAAIKIDGTQHVTIDGSNSGSSTRDMTINAIGNLGARGISISNSSHSAVVKNCIIRTGWTAATDSSKFQSIQVTTVGSGTNCNNVLIENNILRNAQRGISAFGVSNTDSALGLIIRNNLVDSVSTAAIYTGSAMGTLIYNNDVSVLNSASTFTGTVYGIYIGGGSDNCRVYSNRVHDINSAVGGTVITYGISCNTGAAGHGANVIYNNFVAMNITKSNGTGSIYALYDSESTYPDSILYNTVKLTGTSTANRTSGAFYDGSGTGWSVVKNNILINLRTDGTTGGCTAIGRPNTMTATFVSDYNNLYVGTLDAQHNIGRISTTNYSTMANWQANGYDGASISEDAPFVSTTDLHIKAGVTTNLRRAGTPILGYTTDIDGQLRNPNTPDLGSDEFSGTTDVERSDDPIPSVLVLEQNYPNPFNPTTNIRFSIEATKEVTLRVMDVLGREIATLVDQTMAPGTYTVKWNAGSYPSGVYFYTVRAGINQVTRAMILTK